MAHHLGDPSTQLLPTRFTWSVRPIMGRIRAWSMGMGSPATIWPAEPWASQCHLQRHFSQMTSVVLYVVLTEIKKLLSIQSKNGACDKMFINMHLRRRRRSFDSTTKPWSGWGPHRPTETFSPASGMSCQVITILIVLFVAANSEEPLLYSCRIARMISAPACAAPMFCMWQHVLLWERYVQNGHWVICHHD